MLDKTGNRKYLIIFLFVLSFLLYARTINYGFVWDDERIHLTNNQQLMNGDIASFWKAPYSGMYIPLTYSTWAIFKSAFTKGNKLSPKGFHILNVVTHSINCILLFQLLLLLFKNQKSAFIGSLIFLLHQVQVESVVWISEFRGLYSALFSFLSLLFLFKLIDKQRTFSFLKFITTKHFFASTLFFTAALLAKPSAVVLPFVSAILVWCFHKDNLINTLKAMGIWLLLIIPIILITLHVQANEVSNTTSLLDKILISGDSLFFYFQKLLFPYPLVACYGFTPTLILNNKIIFLTTFISLAIFVYAFMKRKTNPLFISGIAIITICLLPVSGILPFEYQQHSNVADRYLYFAILGFVLFVPVVLQFMDSKKYSNYIIVTVLTIYLGINFRQIPTWKNEFTVWDNTLAHYQNSPKVFYNRGVEYSKMRRFDEAIKDYSQSLLLQNNYLDALFNRANAYENIGDTNSALIDYNTYLSIDPSDGSVYFKRSYLFYKEGKFNDAVKDAIKAEQLHYPISNTYKNQLQGSLKK